jgi:hypothetical protein
MSYSKYFQNRPVFSFAKRDQTNKFTSKVKKPDICFNETNFPILGSTQKSNENLGLNYIESLSTKNTEEEEEEKLKPGWVSYQFNKKTRKVDINYGPSKFEEKEKVDVEEEIIDHNVINKMVERWQDYMDNYIELYGEDDYIKHHLFPNYNYHCYDEEEEEYNVNNNDPTYPYFA